MEKVDLFLFEVVLIFHRNGKKICEQIKKHWMRRSEVYMRTKKKLEPQMRKIQPS